MVKITPLKKERAASVLLAINHETQSSFASV